MATAFESFRLFLLELQEIEIHVMHPPVASHGINNLSFVVLKF